MEKTMSFDKSEVMSEFLKIAQEHNLLEDKTAATEPNPHKEDDKTVEEKRLKPEDKSIIELAHPEPIYVAEALGDGALVENNIEQQKKLIEMVNKAPTGSLVGRHASVARDIVKIAHLCDDLGLNKVADLLTDAAIETLNKTPLK